MDEENRKIYLSGAEPQDEFDLEDILAEFRDPPAASPGSAREALADRSRRIVLENLETGFSSAAFASLDDVIESAVAEEIAAAAPPQKEPPLVFVPEPEPEPAVEWELPSEEETSPEAEADAPKEPETESPVSRLKPEKKEKFLSPVVALMALLALRRGQRGGAPVRKKPAAEKQPEPDPAKAARRCTALRNHLRFRGRVATLLSAVMLYLTYAAGSALPLTGALKTNPRALALLLLIFELSVIVAGLDLFTEGILSLVRGKPGILTLVSASCLFSAADALLLGVTKLEGMGLPFCAVSAISMTLAVWGEYFKCSALRSGFRLIATGKNLYTVSGESGLVSGETALLKSRRGVQGFVSRSAEESFCDRVFRILTPVLLIAALLLSVLASLLHGAPQRFFHCLSMMTAASSAFSVTLCFSVPFFAATRSLSASGAAVAGWSGVRDIGGSRRVVLTDGDLFPKGTVEVGNVRILEGAFIDKVISYTGSVIAASGSGLSAPFAELIKRNGYSLSRVEGFEPHDGGGVTAVVNGDSICVGNTGFMNLMGIRVPKKISTSSSVYTAINGALVGIFNMEYHATAGVQSALVTLLHSTMEPVFAIRDFNITPVMIQSKFKMPNMDLKFPAYTERFRISEAEPGEDSSIAAVLTRDGMAPLVDAAERGRRLYNGVRIGTLITVLGCLFGLLMMFLLCWTGSLDNVTARNAVTFMLLWLIPTVVIAWGVQR